eukprot:1851763-Amphidinium_carterae.1
MRFCTPAIHRAFHAARIVTPESDSLHLKSHHELGTRTHRKPTQDNASEVVPSILWSFDMLPFDPKCSRALIRGSRRV